MSAVLSPSSDTLAFTVFNSVYANDATRRNATWEHLCSELEKPKEYPYKRACPLIKLGTYGDKRSIKGCLRHDANLVEIAGIEGDYDGGVVSMEQAATMLRETGIKCCLYSSPSSTPISPRWRVLAPLSRSYPPHERKRFLTYLNRVLGGILASESFTASLAFYFGSVRGTTYEFIKVCGQYIDLLAMSSPAEDSSQDCFLPFNSLSIPDHLKNEPLDEITRSLLKEYKRKTFTILLDRSLTGTGCAQIKDAYENQETATEPRWRSALSVAAYCDDADTAIHTISERHPEYDCQKTIEKAALIPAPHTCTTFEQQRPDLCVNCLHRGKIKSPIALATEEPATPSSLPSPNERRLTLAKGLIDTSPTPSPPQHYILGKFAAAKKVTTLAGLGGVSKTTLATQLGICVALGEPFGDISVSEGAVIALFGEDDQDDSNRRVKAALKGRDQATRTKVAERARFFPWAGQDMKLTGLYAGHVHRTAFVQEIIDCANALESECGLPVRLIIIDHVRLAMAGDANAADHATELMSALTDIAVSTGAAVMLLAHSPKTSIQKGKENLEADASDIAGSGAFVNNARSAEILRGMTKEEAKVFGLPPEEQAHYVKLAVVKNNIGPTGTTYWYRRDYVPDYGTALLTPVSVPTSSSPCSLTPAKGLEARLLDLVREKKGELTANQIKGYATKNGRLKASQTEAQQALDSLIAQGKIRRVRIDATNRGERMAKIGTVVLEVTE